MMEDKKLDFEIKPMFKEKNEALNFMAYKLKECCRAIDELRSDNKKLTKKVSDLNYELLLLRHQFEPISQEQKEDNLFNNMLGIQTNDKVD